MSKPEAELNRIEDKGHTYWIQVPQIVLARSLTPHDFALWCAIKMISGEKGECYLSTAQLADLAMMSAGQASICRRRLIQARLLEGEIRQDAGYPQPVWHLSIPDLWPENLQWREAHQTIESRIEYMRTQREVIKEEWKKQREARKSLQLLKASAAEGGPSAGEGGPPADETKKNQSEIQQQRTGDALWKTVLANLEGQMARTTFDSNLRGSRPLTWEDGQAVIEVQPCAVEWLNHRLLPVVERAATQVLGRPVSLTFTPAATATR